MPTIKREIIDPKTLSPAAKSSLIDELHATHAAIFDGVSKADFGKYVVNSPAERTRIEVYRAEGRIVGYFAVHTFVRTIEGRQWVVVRAESGKLPSHRHGARARLMIGEVLRVCARYPRARKAFLGCFVHPSAYVVMGHVAPTMYPHWSKPTPAPVSSLMAGLADEFGLAKVPDATHEGVRSVGWITREDERSRRSWVQRECEMSSFYINANPGYVEGHGLLILVPIDFATLIEGSARQLRRSLRRTYDALRSSIRRPAPRSRRLLT